MKMKLSEAIRSGSALGPQARGALTHPTRRFFGLVKGPDAFCALGGAFKAAGVGHEDVPYEPGDVSLGFRGRAEPVVVGKTRRVMQTPDDWPMHVETVCPVCGTDNPLYRQIPHLNDLHQWTREQIAQHVEGVEQNLQRVAQDAIRQCQTAVNSADEPTESARHERSRADVAGAG